MLAWHLHSVVLLIAMFGLALTISPFCITRKYFIGWFPVLHVSFYVLFFLFTTKETTTSSNLNLDLFHRVVEVVLVTRAVSVKQPVRLQNSLHWLLQSEHLPGARNLRKQRKAASGSLSFGVCCPRLCQRVTQLMVMHMQLWISK